VSFYNETDKAAIYPTPIVGMVGVLEDVRKHMTLDFKEEGNVIMLLGETKDEIGGSEYLSRIHGKETGEVPFLNMAMEIRTQKAVLDGIERDLFQSVHDLSEGGLAVALSESAIAGNIGCKLEIQSELQGDRVLFSESQSRFLVSLKESKLSLLEKGLMEQKIPHRVLGKTGGENLVITINEEEVINHSIKELESNWRGAIQEIMEK